MLRIILPIFLLLSIPGVSFSQAYNIKLMSWNLLNYPDNSNFSSDTTLRNPYYRTVIQYEMPQIMVTQENANATSANLFLNGVMNHPGIGGGNLFSAGTFINGYDTDNALYYRTAFYQFISNTPIGTALRDINEFKLVHLATGDTIRIYSLHLKAGNTPSDSLTRIAEVNQLRTVTNALPSGTDFIVCGDFNIYATGEGSYQKLVQDNTTDDGNFIDPLTLTGTWNNYNYRYYHTQSTRTRSFNNGATGGLDDRFDMILYSTAVSLTGGVSYTPFSTAAVGNDNNHYNDSINQIPNTAVSQTIADALHYASDHLPVTAVFSVTSITGINDFFIENFNLQISPNPSQGILSISYFLNEPTHINMALYDVSGKLMMPIFNDDQIIGKHSWVLPQTNKLITGVYFIRVLADNKSIVNKKIVIE